MIYTRSGLYAVCSDLYSVFFCVLSLKVMHEQNTYLVEVTAEHKIEDIKKQVSSGFIHKAMSPHTLQPDSAYVNITCEYLMLIYSLID